MLEILCSFVKLLVQSGLHAEVNPLSRVPDRGGVTAGKLSSKPPGGCLRDDVMMTSSMLQSVTRLFTFDVLIHCACPVFVL